MLAIWMLAATTALHWLSGADVHRIVIISSVVALWPRDPDPIWCELPGASCSPSTHTMSYTFIRTPQGFLDSGLSIQESELDRLVYEIHKPAAIPTAKLFGLSSRQIKALCRTPQQNDLATLQHYFDQRYYATDSEPSVTAQFDLVNGQTLKIETATQAMYGLPWTISLGNVKLRSYNPKISLSLAKFLSMNDLNRDFLNGGSVPFGEGTYIYGCR